MLVMGISCYYHDSAVALADENEIKFAIHEERLSRVKHDSRFPFLAVGRALQAAASRARSTSTGSSSTKTPNLNCAGFGIRSSISGHGRIASYWKTFHVFGN